MRRMGLIPRWRKQRIGLTVEEWNQEFILDMSSLRYILDPNREVSWARRLNVITRGWRVEGEREREKMLGSTP